MKVPSGQQIWVTSPVLPTHLLTNEVCIIPKDSAGGYLHILVKCLVSSVCSHTSASPKPRNIHLLVPYRRPLAPSNQAGRFLAPNVSTVFATALI